MTLPFLKTFKKEIDKLETVGVGFSALDGWLSTGNYALNRALSGDFFKGIPLCKLSLMAGPSGSGKSFIASNLVLQAQRAGYHALYLDSEHAVDITYLQKVGVKVDEEHLTYVAVTTIEDVNRVLAEFFSAYIKEYGKNNPDAPKTIIVLDSIGMLCSSTEIENYNKDGTVKADQGILAKRRKAMLRMVVGHVKFLPIAMVLTDHVYPQDPLLGDGAWAITNSTRFSSAIIGLITKLKLKEDGEVTGVRMKFETFKSRFAKLGTKVELDVPYNRGISSTSGLVELLEEMGVIAKGTQIGEKLLWVAEVNGERIKFKEKDLNDEIAQKLFKHPLCAPMIARDEPEINLEAFDTDTEDLEITHGVRLPNKADMLQESDNT